MEIKLNVSAYDPHEGIRLNWEDNYRISVDGSSGELVLSANSEGLLSLANHLAALAQPEVPAGTHIHLDAYNALEDGSADLVIQKTP